MTKMLVMFEVEASAFGAIMDAIGPMFTEITNFRTEEANPPKPVRTATARKPEWNTLGRSKVQQIIMESLQLTPKSPVPYSTLEGLLAQGGFAAKSLSPALTQLVRQGLVKRLGDKTVSLI